MSSMIDDPNTYFHRFLPPGNDLLARLEKEALDEKIPIVGPVVGELLFLLAGVVGAGAVLELGSAIGYSTLHLAAALTRTGGRVVTVESDPEMARRARKNFEASGLADRIVLEEGDALAYLKNRGERFDMLFLDIEKRDYLKALPHCHRLLRPMGLLVADNTAFKDADPFNQAIFADPGWRAVQLFCLLPGHSPLQDGICLAMRN